jgi:hypothetical protein
VVASLALLPGIGQVFAVGVGATALLGLIGRKAGATVAHHLAKDGEQPAQSAHENLSDDAHTFVEDLKAGRSLLVGDYEVGGCCENRIWDFRSVFAFRARCPNPAS